MSIRLTRPSVCTDLGDIWLRDQLARLAQKHAQYGGHYRMDADALLARLACTARANAVAAPIAAKVSAGDHFRRATIDAIAHCSRRA